MSATGATEPAGPVEDLWSEQGTSPDQIDDALRRLLRERHAANETLAPARVLNLVVVVDRDWKGEISNRLSRVGRYHASRTVLCAVEEGRRRLDARATISYDESEDGVGVMLEQVEIDLGPAHLKRLDTIIDPVIVSELPTVLWSPHGHEEAMHTLRGLADVMLLDSDDADELTRELARADDLLASAYVVDLAWLRTTPWRERLASSFDPPARRAVLSELSALTIRHREESSASAVLLAGWFASRLGFEAQALESKGRGALEARARSADGELRISLEAVEQQAPGLSGVTVQAGPGFSLSLDRGQGGLCAQESRGDRQSTWQILGASRGEGGILGEGVRQAHLRDPTYGPALKVARALCPS